jgi:hypothetical protein
MTDTERRTRVRALLAERFGENLVPLDPQERTEEQGAAPTGPSWSRTVMGCAECGAPPNMQCFPHDAPLPIGDVAAAYGNY